MHNDLLCSGVQTHRKDAHPSSDFVPSRHTRKAWQAADFGYTGYVTLCWKSVVREPSTHRIGINSYIALTCSTI